METTKEFKLQHFQNRTNEAYRYRFCEEKHITSLDSLHDEDESNGKRPPKVTSEWKKYTIGKDIWTAHDSFLWLNTEIELPSEWKNKKSALVFEGLAYNHQTSVRIHDYSGPIAEPKWMGIEAMLFLDNEPFQGLDDHHMVAILPQDKLGKKVKIDFRVWSGTDRESRERANTIEIRCVKYCLIDEIIEQFYFWTLSILQTLRQLPETHPNHPPLYLLLDKAHKMIDWAEPGSDKFRKTCCEAVEYIEKEISKIPKYHIATDYATGHTHLDVAWLWRIKHLIEKTARSWSTAVQNLEEDEKFVFLQSQPQLYSYIKEYYPELYEKIKNKVKEGRWDPNGAMWVEADCNLSGGESLTRQILYGKRFFREEFGVDSKYLWLPDVFGYSVALPQILRKTGVDTFITSKISWNQYNRMPHDLFWWYGIDGTKVLTTYIVTPDPKPRENWYYTYNAQMTAEVIDEAWEAFQDKDIASVFVHPYGWGDGGGGTTYEQIHLRQKLEKMPGIPNIKSATTSNFCEELHRQVGNSVLPVPEHMGELYLEYHRGTYTSQADIKKYNRKNELALCHTEMLLTWSYLQNQKSYDKDSYRALWHLYLVNQFHDILPGSSIHNVYIDAREDHRKIEAELFQMRQVIMEAHTTQKDNTWTIFNPLLHNRKDAQKIPYFMGAENMVWKDSRGNVLAVQKHEENLWIFGLEVPSCGWETITAEQGSKVKGGISFVIGVTSVDTPFYIIKWNQEGQIISLYDKTNERDLFKEGEKGNVLELLEDKPRQYDAWEFEPYAEEKTTYITDFKGADVLVESEELCIIRFQWNVNKTVIKQDMKVYKENRRIDFDTYVDWQEREQILRSSWTADVITTKASYDVQYGNVERPTHRNTSWDKARFEVCAHRWADLSDKGYGFSILNESKYGYSAYHNTLRITLLKGSNLPDTKADLQEHWFTYSILPHENSWIAADTVRHAGELNVPCYIFKGQLAKQNHSLLKVEGEANLEIDAFKLAEDREEIIIRIHEYEGKQRRFSLELGFDCIGWAETDFLEQLETEYKKGVIKGIIKPYEIKTFTLKK